MQDIKVIDRLSRKTVTEKVYGKKFLVFVYSNNFLAKILLLLISRFSFFSFLYGCWNKSSFSKRQIRPFIKKFNINTEEFQKKTNEFTSFNDFFIRKIKKRPIRSDIIVPADGTIVVYPKIETFCIKGKNFSLKTFLQDPIYEKKYIKGSMCIIRLAPFDYHRFHFPCDSVPGPAKLINGFFYSVNPIALRRNLLLFAENKRMITSLQTSSYKELLFIEIGATFVSSICQTFKAGSFYKIGEEKGYFSLGGSAIVLLFESNTIEFAPDLLRNSSNNIETRVKFGQPLSKFLSKTLE